MRQPQKQNLRQQMRHRRQQLSEQEARNAGNQCLHWLQQLPNLHQCTQIGLYLSHRGELNTQPIADYLHEQGHQLFLPVVDAHEKKLHFALWNKHQPLQPNHYGIGEPPADAHRLSVKQLDLLLMPVVAFDRKGNRLGMGGGYYDRTLAGLHQPPLKTGLAYSFQEAPALPADPWDIALDYIATERCLIDIQP